MSGNSAVAHINLGAIKHNFNFARSIATDAKFMAIIKADAYGHGDFRVADALSNAEAFGVARLTEAVRLREAGIKTPITLLEGVLDQTELTIANELGLDLVVCADYQVELMSNAPTQGVWIKVDTGMHRLGIPPSDVPSSLARLKPHRLLGIMSHLADADAGEDAMIDAQLEEFDRVTRDIDAPSSLANSAGLLAHKRTHRHWIRPGLMLYGASPFVDLMPRLELKAAMTLTAPIIAIRQLTRGESVGYGSIWTARIDCRVATIALGYADGYPREASMNTPVLVNGQRRKLAGRVSMDMITVALDSGDVVNVGDRVELWGPNLPVEEIAGHAGTVPYTLLCGVSSRVPRHYID